MRMSFLVLALFILIRAASGGVNPCPDGHQYGGAWVEPNCNNPQIVIIGDVDEVVFGPEIRIIATAGAPGLAWIRIDATSPQNVRKIIVSSEAPIQVELVVGLNIANLAGIEMDETTAIRELLVAGRVEGNLGEEGNPFAVIASRLGYTSNASGFFVGGNLLGRLYLPDSAGNWERRIDDLLIVGNVAPGVVIDTESGGIGKFEVRGEIGSEALGSDFVEIRSGLDITLLEAGAMHANIIAMREVVGGTDVYANIRRLKTDKLLGTGNFVGSIRANSVGEPIHRAFEGEGAEGSTPQIEIQGDLGDGLGTTLDFKSALVDNSGLPPLVVGGSFRALSQIIVPVDGLPGQIVFNRDNLGGEWEHLVQ